MSNARSISAQAVIATQGLEGYGVCQCAEFIIGAPVRMLPASNPPVQDATVSWVSDGQVTIETSIDDGRTWERIAVNGGVIPQLTIGRSVTGVLLLVRQRFGLEAEEGSGLPASPGRVTSITATVTLEDGTVVTRTESGAAALALGLHYGTEVDGNAVRARAQPYVGLRGGMLVRGITPHTADDLNSPVKAGLALWLNAASIKKNNGAFVDVWPDDSGERRDGVQTNAARQPKFFKTGANGRPVVRFVGSRADHVNLPDFLTPFTQGGEVFIIVKANAEPAGSDLWTGLWRLDGAGSATHYTWRIDGTLYDGFGSTTRYGTAGGPNPDLPVTEWRLYNVSSMPGAWTSRMDTVQVFTSGTNTVAWPTAPRIGAHLLSDNPAFGDFGLDGDIAEVIIYNHVLNPTDRAFMNEYFRRRYALKYPVIDADLVDQDLHVSHGTFLNFNIEDHPQLKGGLEVQRGDDEDLASPITKQAFANASMAWEMRFMVDTDAPASNMALIGWANFYPQWNFGLKVGLQCTLLPWGNDYTAKIEVTEHAYVFNALGEFVFRLKTGDGVIKRGRWYHMAWSYDGLWATWYLDCAVVGQIALRSHIGHPGNRDRLMGLIVPTEGLFAIGGAVDTYSNRFWGRLNEVRIWSRRLGPGEILARSRRRLVAPAEVTTLIGPSELPALRRGGLRAYYPMTARGAQIDDFTINGLGLDIWDNVFSAADYNSWIGVPVKSAPDASAEGQVVPARISPPLALDVTSNVVRFTNAPFDITFADGRTFTGAGHLGVLSAIQEPGDLTPSGMEFQLNGLNPSVVAIALGAEVQGRPVTVYHVQFDSNGAIVSSPWVLFAGLLDTLGVLVDQTAAVAVTAESHLRNWERASNLRWNHVQQLSEFPDDFGLELMQDASEKEVWWPAQPKQEDDAPDPDATGDPP